MKKSNNKGFTLIEILVVIGIIAILAAIVLIAINPARQFAQARNSQRVSNVNAILNAIGQRVADNKGVFAGGTPNCEAITASTSIMNGSGSVPSGALTPSGTIDLSCLAPTYIPALPIDPTSGAGAYTGYEVGISGSRIIVCAPSGAESAISGSGAICVTR